MRYIEELLNKRIELADRYRELLTDVENIQFPQTNTADKHSYQSFCLFVENRDRIMKQMREKGIEVQIGTTPFTCTRLLLKGLTSFTMALSTAAVTPLIIVLHCRFITK